MCRVLVGFVLLKDERGGVVGASHAGHAELLLGLAAGARLAEAGGGDLALVRYGVSRGVLTEELRVGQGGVGEGDVVVLGPVEELLVSGVTVAVVLRALHVEVSDPTKLSIDVALATD